MQPVTLLPDFSYIAARPQNLPPLLPGENEIDLSLVTLIRDGSMALEQEDWLIVEIVNVIHAYNAQGSRVYWKPEEMTSQTGENYQSGYEIMFMGQTGQPVGILATARPNHGEPIYTKTVPRNLHKPVAKYYCPLSRKSERLGEYQEMGFDACQSGGFLNFASWEDHVSGVHHDFSRALEGLRGEPAVAFLWKLAQDGGMVAVKVRRDSDPRTPVPELVGA